MELLIALGVILLFLKIASSLVELGVYLLVAYIVCLPFIWTYRLTGWVGIIVLAGAAIWIYGKYLDDTTKSKANRRKP